MKRLTAFLTATILAASACGGSSPADESAGALGDSIGVAGYWEIDIVNPDGTVDQHVEFHNEFVGQEVLTMILAGDIPSHGWGIAVGGVEPICPSADFLCRGTGTAVHDQTTDDLVVSGAATATSSGDIAAVYGEVVTDAGAPVPFSQKALDVASGGPGVIPVTAGQIVQVEIRYSFSTV